MLSFAMIPLLLWLCGRTAGDVLEFDPFFGDDVLERSLGTFSGFPFSSLAASPFGSGLQFQESSNIPLYREGAATAPQPTLSELEQTYKAQLELASKLRSNADLSLRGLAAPGSNFRAARINAPFLQGQSSSSHKNERRYAPHPKAPPTQRVSSRMPSVQMESGFIPIIQGSSQDRRSHSQSQTSSVIKDIQSPILTAASNAVPSAGGASAGRHSAGTEPAANGARAADPLPGAVIFPTVTELKPRQSNYSRSIAFNSLKKPDAGSSFSESVVSRVVVGPEPVQSVSHQKDVTHRAALEDSKQQAKKAFDLNCDGSRDLGWCELGERYPRKMVEEVVTICKDVVDRMHVELPHSFEKLSDTSDFKSELENGTREAKERGSHDAWSWASYFHQGALCDAETGFLRPETAKDSSGRWNLIIQTETLKQRIPIEMCRKTNSPCKKMLNCGLKSQCLQKYNYHLLLSLNPSAPSECPFMKLYRFPSACVCHVE